jgi:hypothetical protein
MFHASGDDEHFAGLQVNGAIPEVDPQMAVDDNEGLIGLRVIVPDKVAVQANQLELIIVHLRNDARRPVLPKLLELAFEVDWTRGVHLFKDN